MSKEVERKRFNAAKRIIKVIEWENKRTKNDIPTGYWMDGKYQCISNPYCGALIYEGHYIDGVPHNLYNRASVPIFHIVDNAKSTCTYDISNFMPTVKGLKEYEISVRNVTDVYKRGFGVPIFIGDDLINTRYLIDMMQLLPDASFFVDPNEMCRPVLVKSDYGVGVIMPIRPEGAVNGVEAFSKKYPCINYPTNPENVFFNKTLTRFTKVVSA